MKNLLTAALCAISLITALTTTANAQCPDPNFNVEAQCQPAPAWQAHHKVFDLGNGCYIDVEYCVQWVCRGVAGLSRSRMSISKFRFIGDGGSPCLNNGIEPDANFLTNYNAYLKLVVGKLIGEGAFLNDGPPKPCVENPTDYLVEVITAQCVAQGAWVGTADFGSGAQSTQGWYFNYCPSEVACIRKYKACTQPDGTIKTDIISVEPSGSEPCANNYGYPQTPTPVYPFPPNTTTVVATGGMLAGTTPSVTIYTEVIGDFFKCTLSCGE
ncbi:MAG: hypothetical protein IPM61_02900 [Chlorobi bacterium]|nr:MAG: hypothetical protein UZ07_CHB004002907 [Chlorobi bacterium OLB7]MBK8910254.1 hypothetical protein [Chlorobiota bacterium]